MKATVKPRAKKTKKKYISTGHLPPTETVQTIVDEAYERYKDNDEGQNAAHYPALARVPRHLFGVCVINTHGEVMTAGDADYEFTIMSVSKPFTFGLVCEAIGAAEAKAKLGVNATGLPFNSVMAIELQPNRLTNPMVNSGAIAAVTLVPGETAEAKWRFIHEGLSRFAGRTLSLNDEVYTSASVSNHRNRAIARMMYEYGRLYFDPVEAADIYTRQCSLNITTRDLAVMAATLANGGINPITGEQVLDATHCRHVLAVMTTAGMYENTGDWEFDVGLPGKSGVSGGIITVSPGKGGMGVFAPPLDSAGNSVKGQLVAKFLSEYLGMNIFASAPKPE